MHSFWQSLTWFGDSALLLPMALWLLGWFAIDRATRLVAVWWAVLVGGCGFVVLVSKLAFMGWGIGSAAFNFTGFSGHTALAASIWPVVFWRVASLWRPTARLAVAVAGCGWVWAVLVGCSRIAIGAHSGSEVIAGLLLGTLTSAAFLWYQRRRTRAPHSGRRWLAAALAAWSVFLLIGRPAPTQDVLTVAATWMAGIEQPFTRQDLLTRRAPHRIEI